ncbi:MAG: cell division protein FtsQ/DivIB [Planctomycetota bacterium]
MSLFRRPAPQFPMAPPPAVSVQAGMKRVVVSALLIVIAAALTLSIGGIIMGEVWEFVSNLDEFKVDLGSPRAELPTWARPAITLDLKRTAGLSGAHSIFEPGLVQRIASAYSASPWVLKVNYVNRVFPNTIEIGLTLREPAALVYVGDASYLIDREGVLLSGRFHRWPSDSNRLTTIVPTGRVAPCSPGRTWGDESVQAGVGLLRLLKEYAVVETLKVATIDVSNFRGVHDRKKSEITIWTETGAHIKWGRFAADKRPGEVDDLVKLQNLMTVVKRVGPELTNIEYVDVRWANPYHMRKDEKPEYPLTASP